MLNNNMLLISSGGGVIPPSGRITAPSGRVLYRDKTGHIVMEYTEHGVAKKLRIGNASTRAPYVIWGASGQDTSLDNLKLPTGYMIGSKSEWTTTTAASITDAQLDNWLGITQGTRTAMQNTDVLMGIADTYAAHHCRSITIDYRACDLPLPSHLLRMYCDADTIDKLDTKLGAYPDLALKGWNFGGQKYPIVWSCCELNNIGAFGLRSQGYFNYDGCGKNNRLTVLPIQELAA